MTYGYDVFRLETDGAAVWLGEAMTIADAQNLATTHATGSSRDFLILDEETGERYSFSVEMTEGAAG